MSVTYGFFDSVDGDRTYDADTMSEYFDGLVSNGVYESVGQALQVTYATGMNVQVGTGRAIINCKWLRNSGSEMISITAAHSTLARYTGIFVKLDNTARTMSLVAIDGTPSSTPAYIIPSSSNSVRYLCLAQILVPAGAITLRQSYITDMRASQYCGWVTGIVQQVDTSDLFLQWSSAYNDFYNRFEAWFQTLTDELTVGAYVKRYTKIVNGGSGVSQDIALDMTNYTYSSTDVIDVYVNGLKSNNYTLNDSVVTVVVDMTDEDNVVEIAVTKALLGNPSSGSSISLSGSTLNVNGGNVE